MQKPLQLATAALIISLGVNAWQFSKKDSSPAGDAQNPTTSAKRTDRPKSDLEAPPPSSTGRAQASHRPSSLSEVLAIRDPMARIEALVAFVQGLSSEQIGGVLKDLQPDSKKWNPESKFLAHLLLTRWAQEDPDAAFASLEGRGAKQGAGDALSILSSLASTDPSSAAAWLSNPANSMARQPYLAEMLARSIGEQWGLQDPDAAMKWAASLPDQQRAGAYSGIIGNLAATDPQQAASLAMELDPADRGPLIGEIAASWAQRSPTLAVEWASSLQGTDRNEALPSALGGWARTEPDAAAAFVDQLPEAERSDHVSQVARIWSDQAPADAAGWLGIQPESSGRADAMGHVMWDWTNADPEAAANWLGNLESGPSYDNGVAGLAKAATHVYQDGESGTSWAATIENEQLRGTMLNHSLGQWMRQDPDAAQSWATNNNIPLPQGQAGNK